MFETSPWNLRNRRAFAVLQRLGEMAGTGIVLAGEFGSMPRGLRPAQRAMALVEAGDHALTMMIETAASNRTRRVWKAMTPETGARAVIFLTHGLAATTEAVASAPGTERQREARELVKASFPWSDEEERLLQEQVAKIDADSRTGLDESTVWIAFHAIRFIVGDEAAGTLPGFASLDRQENLALGLMDTSPEALFAHSAWEVCFRHALPPYLHVSDPEGMRGSQQPGE